MSSPADVRDAQRAARRKRIMENKDARMSRVKGDYNQHRSCDSDDEDKLSRFLGMSDEGGEYVVIEPANSALRILVFLTLAVSMIVLEYKDVVQRDPGLFYPYFCVQISILTYMFTKNLLFRKV